MKWIQKKSFNRFQKDDFIVNKLAQIRGVKDLDEWMNPSSKFVHSPYLLENIDEAVQKIIKAIHTQLNIVIIADIDTDGVCSTAIMYNYLKSLTDNVTYIHAQRSDGHGVEKVLDKIPNDTNLIIIVDSSSNSVEECKFLTESGMEVVIIDHHHVDVENNYATLVNCQVGKYPNKNLSGSAMVLKVCQVLDEYLDIEQADDFLDLASVGLVGDMMSVRDMENRFIIHNGINRIVNLGLQQILIQSNVSYVEGISTTNISFKVAPIIGACSRFDKIELALELLTSDDEERIIALTKEMIGMNEKRKTDQKELVERVTDTIDDVELTNLLMVIDNDIESGFRGLIATEVVQEYSRPVFVLAEIYDEHGNLIKYGGSARSVGLIPLKSMCQDSGLFNFATGHEQAFGVEFDADKITAILDYFEDVLDENDLQHVVEYDLEVKVDEIDDFDIKEIEKFSKISGQGFPEPKFKINGIVVEETHTKKLGTHMRAVMGKNNDTIKIIAENDFALMKFRSNSEYAKEIEEHFYDDDNFVTELEVVGSLNLNSFYNWGTRTTEVTKQVFLEDFKIVE